MHGGGAGRTFQDLPPRYFLLDAWVEQGAGHPRATMLIAQKTHLTSILLDTRELDLSTVEQGYRAAIDGER